MLAEAMQAKRPVLVNPTEDQLRQTAEELRCTGKLTCTACRKPITEETYLTRRITLGKGLEAVAHLHELCEAGFTTDVHGSGNPEH
jgi:hypothetical protein